MKTLVNIARILVGILFIISGLVKANDPLGLSYKMQEFFDVWTSDLAASHLVFRTALTGLLTFSTAHSLSLSIGMIVLEIMAGVALLLGWRQRFVTTLLLLLIIFFTFLTGYAYASGKFRNCGCFGDCLPISPLTSFIKDLLLLALSLVLFFARRFIQPVASRRFQGTVLLFFLLLSFGLQWYVLQYLPLADCLPYKKGANIAEGMKPLPHAVPDSFAIQFIYERAGKKFEFVPENLPADLATYTFVERKDKLIRKGNTEPAIKGFVLSGVTDIDSTNAVLQQPAAVLYFYENSNGFPDEIKANLLTIYKAAAEKNIPVYVITTSLNSLRKSIDNDSIQIPFFQIDFTAFRTAARTNPCLYFLQRGTITQKESRHRTGVILQAIHRTP